MATNPAIPYYGYYLNNLLSEDPTQSTTGQAFLNGLRQYDPTAFFAQGSQGGSDGATPTWQLQYDASKLPGGGPQNVDLNPDDYSPLYGQATGHGIQGKVNDPSGITTDPVYGKTTPTSNFTFPKDSNLDDILGPLAVLTFGFGAPFLASAMSGGALGGGAATSSLLGEQAAAPIVEGGAGVPGVGAGSDLAGGLGAGAADELANGGQLAATAPAANASSIALGNALTAAGLPSSVTGLLGKIPGLLGALGKIPGLGGTATGGAPVGGGMGLLSPRGGPDDSMSLLKSFYAPKITTPRNALAQQQGLLDPRLMAMLQGMPNG